MLDISTFKFFPGVELTGQEKVAENPAFSISLSHQVWKRNFLEETFRHLLREDYGWGGDRNRNRNRNMNRNRNSNSNPMKTSI